MGCMAAAMALLELAVGQLAGRDHGYSEVTGSHWPSPPVQRVEAF